MPSAPQGDLLHESLFSGLDPRRAALFFAWHGGNEHIRAVRAEGLPVDYIDRSLLITSAVSTTKTDSKKSISV